MNLGAHCVSPHGTCDCGDPQGHGYSGDRCAIHACCRDNGGHGACRGDYCHFGRCDVCACPCVNCVYGGGCGWQPQLTRKLGLVVLVVVGVSWEGA